MLDFNNFRDFNYINALIFNNLYKLPNDIDLVVGVPRSGMIVAEMIGEFINKPVISIFEVNENLDYFRLAKHSLAPNAVPKDIKKVLLVDDAVGSGETFVNVKNYIKSKGVNYTLITYCVFVEAFSTNKVDIYCQVLKDQFLPWSVIKRGLPLACVDIDGVLCEDVPNSENDDGEKYKKFISNSRPMYIPDREIHTIVSGRLEKYRSITENWLKRHNIKYKHLELLNLPNNTERAKIDVGGYKAYIYNKSGCSLFIESDLKEATTIRKRTGKPVFCTKVQNMIP